jgi:NAD(P) transhydrogenase
LSPRGERATSCSSTSRRRDSQPAIAAFFPWTSFIGPEYLIYAVGDVIGFPALASTGTQQARRAMRCAFGADAAGHAPEILPSAIYTIPEVSMAGQTEDALRKAGVDYVVGPALYSANARGRIIGDVDGFLKLLFRRDNLNLLGVHMIGQQASDLVHIGLIALLTGSNAGIFDDAGFNIPTLGALYKAAARGQR